MANPIKIIIKATEAGGTDAPTVDDLLGQVRDFVDVLRGVEKAVADDGENEIVWRVTGATMNSPIQVELTPFAYNPAVYIGARAERVERATKAGLADLAAGSVRPAYFTEDVLPKARRMHLRVTNGLDDTTILFDGGKDEAPLVINRDTAQVVAKAVERSAVAEAVPYREIGSIEGFAAKAERDGHGRPIFWFKSRLDGTTIKAVATGPALLQLERFRLADLWQGARIRVYGTISYKGLGQIESVSADTIEMLDQGPLPSADDIVDPDFTSGMRTEDYLRELRNG